MESNKGGGGKIDGLEGGSGIDGGKFCNGGGATSITTVPYVIISTFALSKMFGLSSKISTISSSPKRFIFFINFTPKLSEEVLTCILIRNPPIIFST